MYLAHFNLDERPFSITPDPRFVYLTTRHREALAHLLYGLDEGGGFVQLTGEVGTGKTTICRTLLKQLPEHVDAALIFNPQLTVTELLETLCTELHIELPAERHSIKVLVDRLYAYLLDANARGRRTVLIIDEAQNLSTEVLEEVRLLTNLETDDAKLLQVFLIGQPELRTKLASEHLRQLAQRVTARYHLEPLNLDETRLYIRHRLSVAGCDREIFTSRAIRKVYRLTRGMPRRINIWCDRALLGAYSSDAQRVTAAIVARAGREIAGGRQPTPQRVARYAIIAVAVMAVAGFALRRNDLPMLDWIERASATLGTSAKITPAPEDDPPRSAEAEAAVAEAEPPRIVASIGPLPDNDLSLSPERLPESEPAAELSLPPPDSAPIATSPPASLPQKAAVSEPPSVSEIIAAIDGDGWLQAVLGLSRLWRVPPPSAGAALCDWARANELACYSQPLSWSQLRDFDLPAVLVLSATQNQDVHVLLFGLSEDEAMMQVDGREQRIARAELERAWRGTQVLLWRPPLASERVIKLAQRGERVRWLIDTLAFIDGGEASSRKNEPFNAALRERVKDFQRQRGLGVDGVVGPQTFIHLNRMALSDNRPSLAAATDADGRAVSATSVAMGAR